MDVGSLWLGEFISPQNLQRGDLFISHELHVLALKLEGAVMLALAPLDGPFSPPKLWDYAPDTHTSDPVRRIRGTISIEPVDLNGFSALALSSAAPCFAYLPEKGLGVVYPDKYGTRCTALSDAANFPPDQAIRLGPQRLLWWENDRSMELCRF